MSFEAFKWAKSWRSELSSPQMFVLLMIADHYSDKKHRAWPSMATLGDETCLNRVTVSRAVTALAERGLIEVEPWVNAKTGKQMSHRYCLPLYDSLSARADEIPVRVNWTWDKWTADEQ